VTIWSGVDLALKPAVGRGASGPTVHYLQAALNHLDGCLTTKLDVDGRYGPKTEQAVKVFQAHRQLHATGTMTPDDWHQLDWCVYDGWTPAPASLTTGTDGRTPGGPAIYRGRNVLTGEPVDRYGFTREARRLHDVIRLNVAGTGLGKGRAVYRKARGSTNWSKHAMGRAIDPMTDADRDSQLEPDEYVMSDLVADLLVARAQYLGIRRNTYTLEGQVRTETSRGPDLLATVVWTNHRTPNGWRYSNLHSKGKDWSWSAARNTWKALSGRVHFNHVHCDVTGGAPFWTVP
jgi:peptidoglycan hydrolase-like protein with peptidoglycan-binding domain